jgi:tetratricopeptide (TPR) repeat protein
MGASKSKSAVVPPVPVVTEEELKRQQRLEETKKKSPVDQYKEFRDDLLSFSLGEAAFDYAKRLVKEQPNNPALLALLGETAWMYEKVKNPVRREHWTDRMDVFMEGIDATRKCIKQNPDYAPCYRVYTLLAAKASEQMYWFKLLQPFGPIEHWHRVMKRGEKALEMEPTADVYAAMGQITARVASNTKRIWTPYTMYAKYKGVPHYLDLFEQSKIYHLKVAELEPRNVENACRLGMLYYELGDWDKAKRWYMKTRDELTADDPEWEIYQAIAHTHLTTHIAKSAGNWNVPFG